MSDRAKAFGLEFCVPIAETEATSLTLDPAHGCGTFTMLTDDTIDISAGSIENQPFRLIVVGGAINRTITWGSLVKAPAATVAVTSLLTYIFDFYYIGGFWILPITPTGV